MNESIKLPKESVKPMDWIYVGENRAVVSHIYKDEPNKVEVVYLDRKNLAIAEDAQFKDGKWSFVYPEACGTYADNSSRLGEYVSTLRAGMRR